MSTAPLHLLIAIHYHCAGNGKDYEAGTPHGESEGTARCVNDLIRAGLLRENFGASAIRRYEPTEGLAVFVKDGLCHVPFPELKWIMPLKPSRKQRTAPKVDE